MRKALSIEDLSPGAPVWQSKCGRDSAYVFLADRWGNRRATPWAATGFGAVDREGKHWLGDFPNPYEAIAFVHTHLLMYVPEYKGELEPYTVPGSLLGESV